LFLQKKKKKKEKTKQSCALTKFQKKQTKQNTKKMKLGALIFAFLVARSSALVYYDPSQWVPIVNFTQTTDTALARFHGATTLGWPEAWGPSAPFRVVALTGTGCSHDDYDVLVTEPAWANPDVISTWVLVPAYDPPNGNVVSATSKSCSYMQRAVQCAQAGTGASVGLLCQGVIVEQFVFGEPGYIGQDSCDLSGEWSCSQLSQTVLPPTVPLVVEVSGKALAVTHGPADPAAGVLRTFRQFVAEVHSAQNQSYFVAQPATTDRNHYQELLKSLGVILVDVVVLGITFAVTFFLLFGALIRYSISFGNTPYDLSGADKAQNATTYNGSNVKPANAALLFVAILLELYALAARMALLCQLRNGTPVSIVLTEGLRGSALLANSAAIFVIAIHQRRPMFFEGAAKKTGMKYSDRSMANKLGGDGIAFYLTQAVMLVFLATTFGLSMARVTVWYDGSWAQMIEIMTWIGVLGFWMPWLVCVRQVWLTFVGFFAPRNAGYKASQGDAHAYNAALNEQYETVMFAAMLLVVAVFVAFISVLTTTTKTPYVMFFFEFTLTLTTALLSVASALACYWAASELYQTTRQGKSVKLASRREYAGGGGSQRLL
jgi:hypothetical protein